MVFSFLFLMYGFTIPNVSGYADWVLGAIYFDESSYPGKTCNVQISVNDPDANQSLLTPDYVRIQIKSDSDPGIKLDLRETLDDSGVFTGIFCLSPTQRNSQTVRISEGDTVVATYCDETVPELAEDSCVSTSTYVGSILLPLERVPVSDMRVTDDYGTAMDVLLTNHQIHITTDVVNGHDDRAQPFAYLLQIQDEYGVPVLLAWVAGSLSNSQSLQPSVSWTPRLPGTYTVTAFVWESVDNPDPLSQSLSMDLIIQ